MSNIPNIDYKDWYINQKRVPDKQSEEYTAFYNFHKGLCLTGFMMNGVFFNPFLYWHLNIWHTEVDVIDSRGRINDKYANPLLRDNEWIVTNEIERAHVEQKGLIILGIRRFAKALRNNELLYTDSGTIQIGDAKIGQQIYDHKGELTTITGVYPQGTIPIYKMSLEDGREIYCCENHIWRVLDRRNSRLVKDLSIKELLPIYKHERLHNGYKNGVTRKIEECFFAIPKNKCISYEEKQLEIDPYYLGLWLGDGSSRRLGITTIDKEIKEYVYTYAEQLGLKVRVDGYEFIIISGKMEGALEYNTLLTTFKKYSLIQNKHIPKDYLYSSEVQRMALLQGLMDTDGCVYKNGTISFTTTSEVLSKDFYQLCRGLGINLTRKKFIPKLYGKPCGEGWVFTIFTEEKIFRLQRKLDKYRVGNIGKQSKINWATIRDIKLVEEGEATCITVDNEDKLFLTTDYTVTHNSVIEASYIGWGATFDEDSQNVIAGLNAPDIKLITDKLDKGLNFIPEAWRWHRIEDNWTKQVTLGVKTKAGERIPFSQIMIRNLDEGNNEEAIAGPKPRKLIIDEIGKGSFLKGLQAAEPGFTTPYGWACSPILTGCVCAKTKVWTNDGRLINIEDLKQEDGILGQGINSISKESITHLKPISRKDCVEIFLNDGSSLRCSEDHPLLVRVNRSFNYVEFIKAVEVKKNIQILAPNEIDIFGDKHYDDAYLTGLMIGDGHYPIKNTLSVSIDSKEVYEFITNKYSTNIKKEWVTAKWKYYELTLRESHIRELFKNFSILGQSKDKKRLPTNIHEFDKESLSQLIAGYYDADGNVTLGKNGRVVLTSVVIELLEQIKYQLTKFGIYSNLSIEKRNSSPCYGYEGQKDYIGRLYISKLQDCKLFYQHIPIKSKFKRDNLNKIVSQVIYRNHGVIKKSKFKFKENFPKGEYFKEKQLENLRYKTVIRVESIGEQDIYNLTTGTTHTYLANGLITHNTGGDMARFMDAKSLMFDVHNMNFLEYNNEDDEKRIQGLFLSYKYRMEAKEPSTLGAYLGKPDTSSLHQVPMLVSNEEKALKITDEKLEKKRKAGDRAAYLKEKMYYPKKVDDIFSTESTNIFAIELAKRQKIRLLAEERTGVPVVLINDGEKITHEFTDKLPITNFPLRSGDNKDAPIVIYEFPVSNPPYGLYTAGVDPYRQGQAKYSTSLGAVYIYKRMHELTGEKYQDMFVASYCARPDKKEDWEEQARLLIKFYNARALVENDDISFIETMKAKGDERFLEKQPGWLLEVVPNTSVKREYGVHRSSQKIIDFLHNKYKQYQEEVVYRETDDNGNVIRELLGMTKILDPMLLEETIQYNDIDNFDRIVAAELAIVQAIKMDPILGRISGKSDNRIEELYKNKSRNILFTNSRGLFTKNKHKLFK